MDNLENRLIRCFSATFPDLPEAEIASAEQVRIAAWDSTGAITLVNVIEEEFGIEMDFDRLAELDSFGRILDHLRTEVPS
jgi:acyl carrier protein